MVLSTRPFPLSLWWLKACSNLPAVTKALEEAGLEEGRKGDGVLSIPYVVDAGSPFACFLLA